MDRLDIDDLTVEFRRGKEHVDVVRGVSLELRRGERLAIVGESGSGKSVTALAVTRLLPHAARVLSGAVRLDGTNLLEMSERSMEGVRGGRIAMVFQDALTALDPLFTIEQQITAVLERHHASLSRSARHERCVELLRDVGIAEPERRLASYPHQMSGGMRQRALIATALAGDPEILIADEPTTALDVTVQAQIIDLLRQISIDRGMAVVLITHDLGVVADFADRVAVMYSGRIVEEAPIEQIFSEPRHPYTVGLLASLPRLDERKPSRLPAIPGAPPDPARRPVGCAFAPRCARADATCSLEPMLVRTSDRRLACHHPEAAR